MCKQEEGEPVDAFITDLYSLAEHRAYNTLHNKIMCDQIVVGVRKGALSERSQLDT